MPVVTVINFYFTLNNFRVHRIITPIRSKVRKITKANLAKLVLPDLLPDIRHCINYYGIALLLFMVQPVFRFSFGPEKKIQCLAES